MHYLKMSFEVRQCLSVIFCFEINEIRGTVAERTDDFFSDFYLFEINLLIYILESNLSICIQEFESSLFEIGRFEMYFHLTGCRVSPFFFFKLFFRISINLWGLKSEFFERYLLYKQQFNIKDCVPLFFPWQRGSRIEDLLKLTELCLTIYNYCCFLFFFYSNFFSPL